MEKIEEGEDPKEVRKRSLFFILLILFVIFIMMNPGRSIVPGSSAPQSTVQAADNPAPELKKTAIAPEIGPAYVIPDVMNAAFCTAVACVKNPSADAVMQGAEGTFTLTGTRGAVSTGQVYLDAVPPGASTYAICNYIPMPGSTVSSANLSLFPEGWIPGETQLLLKVTGGSIESERARRDSGVKGSILFATGRVDNTTGVYITSLEITVIGLDSANQIVLAESFWLYGIPKDGGQNFRYELAGVYPTTPVFAKVLIEANPLSQ